MAILPGATLGILGGGQLGRMVAMAARGLGYGVVALDPDPDCPARSVVDDLVTAPFEDADAAVRLAKMSDVVTLEIEKVSVEGLRRAAAFVPVRPSAAVLETIHDKAAQKAWLEAHGFPVGPWRAARGNEEVIAACAALGGRCFVKAVEGGYDGRGQVVVTTPAEAAAAWGELGAARVEVEAALDLAHELSVLVARRPSGEVAVYPPALNFHEDRILSWSLLPAPLPERVLAQAGEIARGIAEALGVEGLVAVELFLLKSGALLVNELAPRPHNTFHATEVAGTTSQFEQLVRAVCDLPLGAVEIARPAAIANLLGEAWLTPKPPDFEAALSVPGARLHLYGKRVARPGRKMGHLSAVGDTSAEALERVLRAKRLLTRA